MMCPLCGKEAKLIHSQEGYKAVWCFCKGVITTTGVDPRPRKIDIPLKVWDGTEPGAKRLGLDWSEEDQAAYRYYYPGDYTDSGEMWCGDVEEAERLGLQYMGGLAAWKFYDKGDKTQIGETGIPRIITEEV